MVIRFNQKQTVTLLGAINTSGSSGVQDAGTPTNTAQVPTVTSDATTYTANAPQTDNTTTTRPIDSIPWDKMTKDSNGDPIYWRGDKPYADSECNWPYTGEVPTSDESDYTTSSNPFGSSGASGVGVNPTPTSDWHPEAKEVKGNDGNIYYELNGSYYRDPACTDMLSLDEEDRLFGNDGDWSLDTFREDVRTDFENEKTMNEEELIQFRIKEALKLLDSLAETASGCIVLSKSGVQFTITYSNERGYLLWSQNGRESISKEEAKDKIRQLIREGYNVNGQNY